MATVTGFITIADRCSICIKKTRWMTAEHILCECEALGGIRHPQREGYDSVFECLTRFLDRVEAIYFSLTVIMVIKWPTRCQMDPTGAFDGYEVTVKLQELNV